MANGSMPKDYKFMECRLFRHSWSMYNENTDATFSLECTRCTCLRHDWADGNGKLRKRRYEYPDGYMLTREQRPSAEILRRALMLRLRSRKK